MTFAVAWESKSPTTALTTTSLQHRMLMDLKRRALEEAKDNAKEKEELKGNASGKNRRLHADPLPVGNAGTEIDAALSTERC